MCQVLEPSLRKPAFPPTTKRFGIGEGGLHTSEVGDAFKTGGRGEREGGKASLVFYGGRKIPYLVFTPPPPSPEPRNCYGGGGGGNINLFPGVGSEYPKSWLVSPLPLA